MSVPTLTAPDNEMLDLIRQIHAAVTGGVPTMTQRAGPDLHTTLTAGMEPPPAIVPPNRTGPPSLYPRPDLTPGVVFPDITEADVTKSGYAGRVRSVDDGMKRAVFLRYGLPTADHHLFEVDHFVSLCLGGTNDIENLWPEPAVTPDAPGGIGFHQKDAAEAFLWHEVCRGIISLQAAQDAIRSDWLAVFQSIPHHHPALLLASLAAPQQP